MDASHVGAGAVLLQVDEQGIDHPVQRSFKEVQCLSMKLLSDQKEVLALILALQHFQGYLDSGISIVLFTDHNPLTFLNSLQNPNQRIMRWALFLQPYYLDFRHIKGRDNIMADALSRAPL